MTTPVTAPAPIDPRLAALRERGLHLADPVRFRYLEALARRTAARDGETRQLLDRRLTDALSAYAARHDRPAAETTALAHGFEPMIVAATANPPSPLADLLRHLERQSAVDGVPPDAEAPANGLPQAAGAPLVGTGTGAAVPELKALSRFRRTWTRLRTDLQLAQSLASAPDNPGPLNSHGLALRALQQMRALSPGYLARFMAHIDTLLWLEHTGPAAATTSPAIGGGPAPSATPRAPAPAGRGRTSGPRRGRSAKPNRDGT